MGFGRKPPLLFKTTTMNLKDKIIHYLVYGTLCMIVYISVCIFFEVHSLYKKLKQWN